MMLDSGSAVSLIHQATMSQLQGAITRLAIPQLHLVTASGDPLPIIAHLQLPVILGEECVSHNFVVVNSLVVPVILGVDFLQTHGLMLDFSTVPVTVSPKQSTDVGTEQNLSTLAIYNAEHAEKFKRCPVAFLQDTTNTDMVDECAIPCFTREDVELYQTPLTALYSSCYMNINNCLDAPQARLILQNTLSLLKDLLYAYHLVESQLTIKSKLSNKFRIC